MEAARARSRCPGSWGLLLLLGLGAGQAALPKPALVPCELEHPLRLTVVPAQCTTLAVAEDPQQPRGRQIALYVARVPAVSRRKLPDPLLVLAGGPGQAASDFYVTVASAFARIHLERDIVLVDQRGTGRSNPLDCHQDPGLIYRAGAAEIAADTRRCLGELGAHADVAWYTTSVAVADLEQVRRALGIEQLNLYGTSYGTRVAQQYLRRYPRHVRSLILDGVVPAQLAVGADTALVAEQALLGILARCARDRACQERFGDPERTYHAVRAALAGGAVPVMVADPASGEPRQLGFTSNHLATVLRLASYTPEYAALLPLLLDEADARHDYAPLAAQFLVIERAYSEAVASGMHNSVVCAEDVPFWDLSRSDRARLAATFLGTQQLDGLASICAVWPRGPVDADLHAPLASDVPALLLSGSDDPVTPPAYAELAQRGLRRGRQLLLPGFGHGALTAPCVDRLLAQFLERGSADGLDVSCLAALRPQAFFLSRNGPAP